MFTYLKDTRAELSHVAWPTQQQTIQYTTLVVLLSIAVALYVGFFDFLFTQLLERVIFSGAAAPIEQQVAPGVAPQFDINPDGITTTPAADTGDNPIE